MRRGSRLSYRTRRIASCRFARAERAKGRLSPVLRAVQGAREHAFGDADRFDPEGRLLRQSSRLQSSLEGALFPDNVPIGLYDNLIAAVRKHLPAVHRYYDVRRRKMKLREIHQYDTYVPILSDLEIKRTWGQAVDLVIDALATLGSEYCSTLKKGLTTERWCDRYPNQGKSSGAFSSGSYDSPRATS